MKFQTRWYVSTRFKFENLLYNFEYMDDKVKHRIQTYSESKNSFFYRLIKKIILDAREKFFYYFENLTE